MLVLLHGFGGRPEVFDPTRAELPAPLEQNIIALPLPGHDPSCPIHESDSFEDLARALLAKLPERFELLGYSLGARLALAMALQSPARISRLSLIGVHPGLDDPQARAERAGSDAEWASRIRREGPGRFFEAWDASPLFAGRRAAPAQRLEALAALRRQHQAEPLALAMERLSLSRMPSYGARLSSLRMSTALIVGARDHKFRELAHSMLGKLPEGSLHLAPDSGHDVPFEAPAWLAAFIRRFHAMA